MGVDIYQGAPSPDEIKVRAAAVRREWSARERESRRAIKNPPAVLHTSASEHRKRSTVAKA